MNLKELILKQLRSICDKLEGETCEISAEEAIHILQTISHQPLSKVEACQELGISRSKFDTLIRNGHLPPGRKRVGWNELSWYRDEILLKYNQWKDGK